MNGEDRKIIVDLLNEKIDAWREEHKEEIQDWRKEHKEDMREVKTKLEGLPCAEHGQMLGELRGCVNALKTMNPGNPGNNTNSLSILIFKLLKKILLKVGFWAG